jgi:hypothetical protein
MYKTAKLNPAKVANNTVEGLLAPATRFAAVSMTRLILKRGNKQFLNYSTTPQGLMRPVVAVSCPQRTRCGTQPHKVYVVLKTRTLKRLTTARCLMIRPAGEERHWSGLMRLDVHRNRDVPQSSI